MLTPKSSLLDEITETKSVLAEGDYPETYNEISLMFIKSLNVTSASKVWKYLSFFW